MDITKAACDPARLGVTPKEAVALFFPTRAPGQSNHGAEAIRICQQCPIRQECLREAVELRMSDGIWGGAGTARRRALRKAARQNLYDDAAEAHFASLDGHRLTSEQKELLASYGDNAKHGTRETYARGCTCEPCATAASLYSISQTIGVTV